MNLSASASASRRRSKALSDFTELVQHDSQLESNLEALVERGWALGELLESVEGLLEPASGVGERRPRRRLQPGLAQIVDSLLPYLTSHGVTGEALHFSAQAVLVEILDRLDDSAVKRAPALAQQSAVRGLVHERMLEGVLEIRIEAGLVQELGGLQGFESAPERFLGADRRSLRVA